MAAGQEKCLGEWVKSGVERFEFGLVTVDAVISTEGREL